MKAILFVFVLLFSAISYSAPVLVDYSIEGDVSFYEPHRLNGCSSGGEICRWFVKPNTAEDTDVKITAVIDFQYPKSAYVYEGMTGFSSFNVTLQNSKEIINLVNSTQGSYKYYSPGLHTLIFMGTLSGLDAWAGFTVYRVDDPSAVPLPASAFLFAPALLGLMGLRRKRS